MARILLVEDDPNLRPLLEHILLEEQYHVSTAETVVGGLAFLDAEPFDLAICDVNLPDGNGLVVADKATAVGIKALIVTAHGLTLKPGALAQYDYLLKPVRIGELLRAVERCLAEQDRKSGVPESH
jgi:DNA-binding NtrC family response regulator